MTDFLIREVFVDTTKHAQFGETEPYEPSTNDLGRLYANLRKEYGRASNMYLDTKSRGTIHTGWVFSKRMKYEDARGNDPERDYYTREVWVHVYEKCGRDDPLALRTERRDGSVTLHPFKTADIDALRKALRKAAA